MQRICRILFATLALLLCGLGWGLAEEEPFQIDRMHAYDNMGRSYAQNYTPTIASDTMYVVLPLTSEIARGEITAVLTPGSLEHSPIKVLSDQGAFEKTFQRQSVKFGAEALSVYKVAFALPLYASRLNGEYPYTIAVRGQDEQGRALAQTFQLIARVADGRANAAAPRLGIVACEPVETLLVGETGALRIRVQNESDTREARAIVLRVSDGAGDILPAHAGEMALGTLRPGEVGELLYPLTVLAKAAAQAHSIEIGVRCEYADGQVAEQSRSFTVDVRQEIMLRYEGAALPARVTQGGVASFSATLMNMGKGTLYNVLLSFDIPGLAGGGSVLVGEIPAGTSKAGQANFRVDAAALGEVSGTLRIECEDAYGERTQLEVPLSTVIEAQRPAVAAASAEAKEEETGLPGWAAYALSLALALALVVQGTVYRRKVRALEEQKL